MLFYQGLSGVCRKALAPFLGGKGAARPLTYPVQPGSQPAVPTPIPGGLASLVGRDSSAALGMTSRVIGVVLIRFQQSDR